MIALYLNILDSTKYARHQIGMAHGHWDDIIYKSKSITVLYLFVLYIYKNYQSQVNMMTPLISSSVFTSMFR